ncbi:MAG: hypothetical protein AAFV43_15375 [Planctomycetota bacterium]
MFIGPVFTREALTAPRRLQHFGVRVLAVAGLLGLTLTAWQVVVGAGTLEGPGELSRFGLVAFRLIAPLALTVAVLFSALLSAAAVSQEKSRGTMILLLLTDLRNRELVLGRLLASLLSVFVAILAVGPYYLMLTLLGGVDTSQVAGALAVTATASLAAGSLGSLLALWREKTFQALALTAAGLFVWAALGEALAAGALGQRAADYAVALSPWQAIQAAMAPGFGPPPEPFASAGTAAGGMGAGGWIGGAVVSLLLAFVLNLIAIVMVRVWNPSREARPATAQDTSAPGTPVPGTSAPDMSASDNSVSATAVAELADAGPSAAEPSAGAIVRKARGQAAEVHRAAGRRREVWDNPVLWREVRTWAYGKKVLVVKAAYLVILALSALAVSRSIGADNLVVAGGLDGVTTALAPLAVLSLVLVNALSVTSLTGERDAKSLDLLLASDLTAPELILGKLWGVLWNTREMIVGPLALGVYLAWAEVTTSWESTLLAAGYLVLVGFAAVLGLHAALIYASSRKAIGVSVGTLLFLFLGVATCMRVMLALSGSFEYQLPPFLGFIFGGGVSLYAALAWRNPSTAMGIACLLAPLATFYAIVSFLDAKPSLAAIATVLTFGFATAAMLVPALSELEVASGGGGKES